MSSSNHPANLKFRPSTLKGIFLLKRHSPNAARSATAGAKPDGVRWSQTFWGRRFIKSTTMALALLCSASIALADVKIATKSTAGGQSITSTTYIKGARQRTEGLGYTTIYQCDLKRMIQINDKTRSYLVTPLAGASNSKAAGSPGAAASTTKRRGGVITYTTTSTDTGERKQVFGMTAKRFKSKIVVAASEGACNSMNMEMETDGWYVDFPSGQNCQAEAAASLPFDQSDCVDDVRYKTEGAVNTGYPIMTITQIKFNTGADGPAIPASTSTQEVVDISTAALDRALFEIPAGYTEVKSSQELGSPY